MKHVSYETSRLRLYWEPTDYETKPKEKNASWEANNQSRKQEISFYETQKCTVVCTRNSH
jgi:hypothetical protein